MSMDIGLSPNDYWKFSVDRINEHFKLDQSIGERSCSNINQNAIEGEVRIFLDQERPRRTDEEFEKFLNGISKIKVLTFM